MKTLILLLFTCPLFAQFSVYAPLKTNHFKKSELYAKDEGGNDGAVLSYEKNNMIYSVGYMRNSFGNHSKMILIGYNINKKYIDISFNIGAADGYNVKRTGVVEIDGRSYTYTEEVETIKNTDIMPYALIVLRKKVYKNIGIQLNISPLFINYGVYFSI